MCRRSWPASHRSSACEPCVVKVCLPAICHEREVGVSCAGGLCLPAISREGRERRARTVALQSGHVLLRASQGVMQRLW